VTAADSESNCGSESGCSVCAAFSICAQPWTDPRPLNSQRKLSDSDHRLHLTDFLWRLSELERPIPEIEFRGFASLVLEIVVVRSVKGEASITVNVPK
jgi:hypothetical protein